MEQIDVPVSIEPRLRLRLYIARLTPNSVRAEHNLSVAIGGLGGDVLPPPVEIIDVFANPHRAITDGIIVTPTLISINRGRRIHLVGDLSSQD